jgi:ketosteroid isomerase-like protein
MHTSSNPDAAYVRLITTAFHAFTSHDVEAFLKLVDPEIELRAPTAERARGGSPYVGSDGIRQYFEDVARIWRELRLIPQLYGRRDNMLVVTGRVYARDADGLTDSPAAWLVEEREGRIGRLRIYTNRHEALEAASLSADELKPIFA